VRTRGAEVLASAPRLTNDHRRSAAAHPPSTTAVARDEAALPMGWRVIRPRTRAGALCAGRRGVARQLVRGCDCPSRCSQPTGGLPCPITPIASPRS
jgi:hypothetical protein